MALALTTICIVCAALLGWVYSATKGPIEASNLEKVNEGIREVLPEFDNNPYEQRMKLDGGEMYPATLGGIPSGYAVKVSTSGFGGALVMMVGFTPDGTIYNTSVISHSETPGLGAKISDAQIAPRVQVIGKNPGVSPVKVKNDKGDIDAITASTITSRAFLKGINEAYAVLRQAVPESVPAEPATSETNGNESQE